MAHSKADKGKQCEKNRNPKHLGIHILRASTACQGMKTDRYKFKQRNMTNHLDTVIFLLNKQTMCQRQAFWDTFLRLMRHQPKDIVRSSWVFLKEVQFLVNHKSKLKMPPTRRREGGAEAKSHVYSKCLKMLTLLKSQTHPTNYIKLDSGSCSASHQISDTRKDIPSRNLCVLTF